MVCTRRVMCEGICVRVCLCLCVREREREGGRGKERVRERVCLSAGLVWLRVGVRSCPYADVDPQSVHQ